MIIQNNIMALNSHRQLAGNNSALGRNLEKLSSGFRINRAGDDAAGLAISEKMRAQIRGLESARSNAQDGIQLIQTAEGALTEVHSMLNRMVHLATQSANGIYDDQVDRRALNDEFTALKSEIDRIAQATNFNGRALLDGSLAGGAAGSVGGAGNSISRELQHIMSFGLSAPVPADHAVYRLSTTGAATMSFLAGIGVDTSVTANISAGAILSAMGLNDRDFAVLSRADAGPLATTGGAASPNRIDFGAANAFNNAHIAAGTLWIVARNAGVDPMAQQIISAGNASANRGGFMEHTAGRDAVRETTLTITRDQFEISQTALLNNTFTINGVTFQFTGQDDRDFNDVHIGVRDGVELENGNRSVNISSGFAAGGGWDFSGITNVDNAAEFIAHQINLALREVFEEDTRAGAQFAEISAIGRGMGHDRNSGSQQVVPVAEVRNMITFNVLHRDWGVGPGGAGVGAGGLRLQIGDTADEFNAINIAIGDMSTRGLSLHMLNISTYDQSARAIGTLDTQGDRGTIMYAVNAVSSQRAALGALQNRLEHTINNLGVTTENLQAAESRIRDTDMAREMMNFTRSNILVQASQAMLAQANIVPQGVLQLIR